MKKFINKIADIRKAKGIYQKDLANALDTKQQVISQYETGNVIPSLEKLVEIAIFLNVSLDDLVEIQKMHNQQD